MCIRCSSRFLELRLLHVWRIAGVLRETAADNRENSAFSPDTSESVEKNFYMDDFPKSLCDDATGVRIFCEMTALLALGGFQVDKVVHLLSRSPVADPVSRESQSLRGFNL